MHVPHPAAAVSERSSQRVFRRAVLSIAVPSMLQQLITSFVNLLDNLMIGQLSTHAIAAVAAANRFFVIGFFAVVGITSAATIYIAQFHGANNVEGERQSFRYMLLSAWVVFLPFFCAAQLFPRQIIGFFNHDPGLVEPALDYIPIAALSFLPQLVSYSCQNSMRALGHTRLPLVITISTVFMNAIWNWILIFGHLGFPALGVTGAALGTLIARIVELAVTLLAMRLNHFSFSTRIRDLFKLRLTLVRAITRRGLPLCLNEIGYFFGIALLFRFYATRGTDTMAALTISGTTSDLFSVLFGGMAAATTVIVSQPLGRGHLEEARSNAYRIQRFSTRLAALFGVLLFGASFITPQLYNVEPHVRGLATQLIRIVSFMYWIYMANSQTFYILRAGGDTRSTLILDTGYMFAVNISVVSAVTYLTEAPIQLLYLIGQLTDLFKLILSRRFLRRETWLKNLAAEHEDVMKLEPAATGD